MSAETGGLECIAACGLESTECSGLENTEASKLEFTEAKASGCRPLAPMSWADLPHCTPIFSEGHSTANKKATLKDNMRRIILKLCT